ncbi:MAG TPA: Holliday junction branch migration DNA helicase RuvB [Candidatus Paceibacterota bacterium]|nr:Holliday junction branch migration DNA helicase RuvB [Candidatus Paceibacterota bacterium]
MSTSPKTPPLSPSVAPDEGSLDLALRPQTFGEYVGQENIKENLGILLKAAKMRNQAPEHMLLHGPSGLGKTTLAFLIAKELGTGLKITSGTALEKAGDVGSILTGLSDGDVLFIDEVHRLNKAVEEVIYPAMENFKLDIVIGKGNAAKTLQIDLPRFTLVAATTKISLLSAPFRSRFGGSYRLDYYSEPEILEILKRSAELLDVSAEPDALKLIASSCRATPRIANRLLKRVRDFAQVHGVSAIDGTSARKALAMMEIDGQGLEETDRRILRIIATTFGGGPVGVKSIAAALSEEESTVEDVYEPYLLRIGFIARTAKGRMITDSGRAHIGLAAAPRKLDF